MPEIIASLITFQVVLLGLAFYDQYKFDKEREDKDKK